MLHALNDIIDAKSVSATFALYTQAQTRVIEEKVSDVLNIPLCEREQLAAQDALTLIKQRWDKIDRLVFVCGKDSKAADGLLLAQLASQSFFSVSVLLLDDVDELCESAAQRLKLAKQERAITWLSDIATANLSQAELIIDAITQDSSVANAYADTISLINQSGIDVFSLHQPSGLCIESAIAQHITIQASVTLSIMTLRLGLLMSDGLQYSGDIYLTDMNLPENAYEIDQSDECVSLNSLFAEDMTPRNVNSYKNNYGHVLIVGGDKGFGGAAIIAAKAAARAGAGLVSCASHPEHLSAMLTSCPDVMAHSVRSGQELEPLLDAPDVIVVGPGMKESAWSDQLLRACLQQDKPLVVDAGALHLISKFSAVMHKENWVLLPHPGEAGQLLGQTPQQIQNERVESITKIQALYGGVVVLKGAGTLLKSHDQSMLSPFANAALASAGMGDALAGITGALIAQGEPFARAAALAVNIHLDAAQYCSQNMAEASVLTEDVIAALAVVLK